jgi:hypothetical protein
VIVGEFDISCVSPTSSKAFASPEVEDLDHTVWPDLDVGRLQIAMNDPARVCGVEGLDNLSGRCERLVGRQRTGAQSVFERYALDELHHEIPHIAGAIEAVDVCDVGMVERPEDARLAFESRCAVGCVQ